MICSWNNISLSVEETALQNKHQSALKGLISEKLICTDASTPLYKVLHHKDPEKWILPYRAVADEIRDKYKDLVIISMGGAALNPKSLLSFVPTRDSTTKIHFLDSTDPFVFASIMQAVDLSNCCFLVISNSGETIETIELTKAALQMLKGRGDCFYFITGSGMNSVRNLANQVNAKIFDHEEQISGRFSSFTSVVTLPGLVAGLDMESFFEGANKATEDFWRQKDGSVAALSASRILALHKPNLVNIGYFDAYLGPLTWYCQIIAESLGKGNDGFSAVINIAPEAHHSVFQSYFGGARDKLFSTFSISTLPESYLTEMHKGVISAAQSTFYDLGIHARNMVLEDLSEYSLGEFMAYCTIETVLLAELLHLNPFDQPAVQLLKDHLKRIPCGSYGDLS